MHITKKDPIIEQGLHILEKFNLKPHKIVYERPFDWARVTEHYNETKLLKPDDWWIVAEMMMNYNYTLNQLGK